MKPRRRDRIKILSFATPLPSHLQAKGSPSPSENGALPRLRSNGEPMPTMRDVISAIPESCFERSLVRSLLYLTRSLMLTIAAGVLAALFIPYTVSAIPLWIGYAIVAGTVATGLWVVAHECGHRAFCKNSALQDSVGFILHSFLLVPYFSWQRSHAIHHAKTNHLDDGETHVPARSDSGSGPRKGMLGSLGDDAFAIMKILRYCIVGWPSYLLFGVSGGPSRGITNHFWPHWPFQNDMFVGRWRWKVLLSTLGVGVVLAGLVTWGWMAGSAWPVLALYVGPYLVVNFWLVLYTWLHHTDVDIPHLDSDEWTWVEGAFLTVDRPYGWLLDELHHRIGSTHVAHHIYARIPHYHAQCATDSIREAFPDLYRYDPTPIPVALFRIARRCEAVVESDRGWVYEE